MPTGPEDGADAPQKRQSGPRRLDSPPLVALGTAAVLAVYSAGFLRTREAEVSIASGRQGRRSVGFAAGAAAETEGAMRVVAGSSSGTMQPAPEVTPELNGPLSAADASAADASATGEPPLVPPVQTPTIEREVRDTGRTFTLPPSAPPDQRPDTLRSDSAATRAVTGWRDGAYAGWGSSRHGDIEATVVIEQGRIVAASISRCLTRYSCSWIAHLQPQVVTRQSPEVDNVSGATESADAFYYAVVDALKKAK